MPLSLRDRTLATFASWIPRAADVAIIDVPVHRNPGDLFILAVTCRLLADLDCRLVFRAGIRDYRTSRARRSIGRDTILVGLGGGNLGDVYPRYQDLRERIVSDFPRNRIVILPQTVYFADRRHLERATRRLSPHPDLRIAVRDLHSVEAVRRFTPHVELLPDLVHGLGISPDVTANTTKTSYPAGRHGVVFLKRRDREASAVGATGRTVDWPDIFPGFLWRLAPAASVMAAAPAPVAARMHEWWSAYARQLLARGFAWMREVDHLVTDRLHAAILARLAGRPVTICDNAYGKLTSYYEAWWRDDPAIELRRP